jgi:protein-disulfide isomerase
MRVKPEQPGSLCYNPDMINGENDRPLEDLPAQEDDGFLRIRRSALYAALLPLAFVTGLALGFLFWGRQAAPPLTRVAASNQGEDGLAAVDPAIPEAPPDLRTQQGQIRLEVSEDDDAVLGPADAPITIIEFSDFRCPFCKRFHNETLTPLLDHYPQQIRLIYRDFPVVGGFEAALAAECADEQGDFFAFHDLLFSDEFETLGSEAYTAYAERLGMDAEALLACVEDGTFVDEVEADARYAAGLGVSGTPTFFINGIPLVGAQPIEAFMQIIDAELES